MSRAEAYQEWTQAAVVDRLIASLPDVVRAMSEPLSKVDKITIVSTGNEGQYWSQQAHWRDDQDCRAGAGALRSALRHEPQRPDGQHQGDEAARGGQGRNSGTR